MKITSGCPMPEASFPLKGVRTTQTVCVFEMRSGSICYLYPFTCRYEHAYVVRSQKTTICFLSLYSLSFGGIVKQSASDGRFFGFFKKRFCVERPHTTQDEPAAKGGGGCALTRGRRRGRGRSRSSGSERARGASAFARPRRIAHA